ncbi:hypothetical protein BO225_07745 [Dubosiella newyorkensis]|uniref:Uncharacterized protein n=1 Tax=Dubosiella newyorkensis TaxID=1862672 RepID=A0A1U7NLS3_9FIRM|nr:hypothetical protein BO225_07745 [Dubosiella newyorkensis]
MKKPLKINLIWIPESKAKRKFGFFCYFLTTLFVMFTINHNDIQEIFYYDDSIRTLRKKRKRL